MILSDFMAIFYYSLAIFLCRDFSFILLFAFLLFVIFIELFVVFTIVC